MLVDNDSLSVSTKHRIKSSDNTYIWNCENMGRNSLRVLERTPVTKMFSYR